jgi:hypothetical protein
MGPQAPCAGREGSGTPHAPGDRHEPGRGNRPRWPRRRRVRRCSRCHLTTRPAASSSAACQSAVSMVTASGRSLRPRPLYGRSARLGSARLGAPPAPKQQAGFSRRLGWRAWTVPEVPHSFSSGGEGTTFREHASPNRLLNPPCMQLLKLCLFAC